MTKTASDGSARRRKDRANVANRLQGVFVKCEQLAPGLELRVFNISELGVGVDALPVKKAPGPDEVLEGKLLVGTTVAQVRLRLAHIGNKLMGLEFVDPSSLLRGAIQRYFEIELVGASLCETSASNAKKRIYESLEGQRLEIQMRTPEAIESFTIYVLGNSIQWEAKSGLRLIQNGQNGRSEPVPEFLLKQLSRLARSAENVEYALRMQVEAVLSGISGVKPR